MKKNFTERVISKFIGKEKKLTKKRKIVVFGSLALCLTTLITTGSILPFIKTETNIYYDGIEFKNKEEFYNYVEENSERFSYNFDTREYLFENNLFDSSIELEKYIDKKFGIEKELTKRNIGDYLINTSGELNSLVKMDSNEKVTKIYEGSDSLSYLNENEAKETFQNRIKKKYKVEEKYFENHFSAKEYLKEVKIKELSDGNETSCYIVSEICFKKEELTEKIRNEIYSGFIIDGQEFSDLNYADFVENTKIISETIVNKHVKEKINANKNTYWIDHITQNLTGSFVGPKYVETENKLDYSLNFNLVKNSGINRFLSGGILIPVVLKVFLSVLNLNWQDDRSFDLEIFLEKNHENLNISEHNYVKIIKFLSESPNLRIPINQNLDEIKNAEFTPFHKMLVAFRRISEFNKIYDLQTNGVDIEELLKDIMLDIMSSQDEFFKTLSNGEGWAKILSEEKITYEQIYNFLVQPSYFVSEDTWFMEYMDRFLDYQGFIDRVMSGIGLISGIVKAHDDFVDEIAKIKNKSNKVIQQKISEQNNLLKEKLLTKSDEINSNLKLDYSKSLNYAAPVALILEMVVGIWELGNLFGPLTYNTYEAKIDDEQSIYYSELSIKMPILEIPLLPLGAKAETTLLNKSPLESMPQIDGLESKKLYVFKNKYYHTKEGALVDLRYDMYLNPENYAKTQKMFTNSYNSEHIFRYELPSICNINDIENTGTCLTQNEYDQKLEEEKSKYVDLIFNEFYASKKRSFYLDGFGSYFDTKEAAIKSLGEKIDRENNFSVAYSYLYGKKNIIRDSKEEIIEFINENQIINSKKIMKSDLISTIHYGGLNGIDGWDYAFYKFNYYGQIKYFRSKNEAIKWLKNNLNIEVIEGNNVLHTYHFEEKEFLSLEELNKYLDNKYINI